MLLTLKKIADVKTYFDEENSPESDQSLDSSRVVESDISPADVLFSISRTYSREDIIRRLPAKADLDRWLATWFTTPDSLRCTWVGSHRPLDFL